jgi:hypothetical protein
LEVSKTQAGASEIQNSKFKIQIEMGFKKQFQSYAKKQLFALQLFSLRFPSHVKDHCTYRFPRRNGELCNKD